MQLQTLIDPVRFGLSETEKTKDIRQLTADSREVISGALFAAFDGFQKDGRDYIPQAIENGAHVILMREADLNITIPDHVTVIKTDRPRQVFAKICARFIPKAPEHIVAVTGSNGKSSVVSFCKQIWEQLGYMGASYGTIGIEAKGFSSTGNITTPDPVSVHETLHTVADHGVTHLAIEASSHGLDQYRLDGITLKAAGFTNISRDHLDYHGTMEDYTHAKSRLFSELLPKGKTAVLNADHADFERLKTLCKNHDRAVFSYGENADDLKIIAHDILPEGQSLKLKHGSETYDIHLNLVGQFQAYNLLCAIGLVLKSSDVSLPKILNVLPNITGVRGRMEYVGRSNSGGSIFVDYAHTPDGLETILKSLRAHTAQKLHVVFGCGGDRDTGKRPIMGKIAAELADTAIVTDDNPRSEPPAHIRAAVCAADESLIDGGDRKHAITQAIAQLEKGDILVVAGKGHENGQTIGDTVIPFDDANVIRDILKGQNND